MAKPLGPHHWYVFALYSNQKEKKKGKLKIQKREEKKKKWMPCPTLKIDGM